MLYLIKCKHVLLIYQGHKSKIESGKAKFMASSWQVL